MNIQSERQLRGRTALLPLEWIEQAKGRFEGDSREEFAELVAAAHIVSDEARLGLHRWIDAGRRAGLSWSEIGATLGISKQAAQQRFGAGAETADAGGEGEISVRRGATAFNEMRLLDEEGRKGRELVGTGALALRFRQTPQNWEYRRLVGLSPGAEGDRLGREGWTLVSSWFPFHYFKRPAKAEE